ncbi:MAG: hypothetical protein Q4D41_10130 [Prevotellaceae bacterium]|nr:hypothetical protein [Prevotellaceae bacterium]
MNTFDIKRFCQLLLWTITTSKKDILTVLTIFFIVLTAMINLPYIIDSGGGIEQVRLMFLSVVAIAFSGYYIFATINGCWIYSNMATKQQRITFKMLPASDVEKYWVRVVYVIGVWIIGGFIVFCLADLFGMLVRLIMFNDYIGSIVYETFKPNNVNETDRMMVFGMDGERGVILANLFLIFSQSIYVLGGAFFRRRQFVFTLLTIFAAGIILLLLLDMNKDAVRNTIRSLGVETFCWIMNIVLVVWSIVNYWLAYVIFKRMQVINNKWINV